MNVAIGAEHAAFELKQGVEHDDMNVRVVGGRVTGESVALELVRAFLGARNAGEKRPQQRLEKVKALERRFTRQRRAG